MFIVFIKWFRMSEVLSCETCALQYKISLLCFILEFLFVNISRLWSLKRFKMINLQESVHFFRVNQCRTSSAVDCTKSLVYFASCPWITSNDLLDVPSALGYAILFQEINFWLTTAGLGYLSRISTLWSWWSNCP